METFRHFFSLILFVCFFLPSTIFRNQGNDGSTAFHADWIEFYWMFISLNVSRFALIFEKKNKFHRGRTCLGHLLCQFSVGSLSPIGLLLHNQNESPMFGTFLVQFTCQWCLLSLNFDQQTIDHVRSSLNVMATRFPQF